MNETQRKTLKFIRDYIENNGYSPSLREIADGVGLSSAASVRTNIQFLVGAGILMVDEKVSRSVRLTGAGEQYIADNHI